MPKITLPPRICLEPFNTEAQETLERPIDATSSLSRNASHLHAALEHAVFSKNFSSSTDPFSVAIVGGSYGPEADTLAASLYYSGKPGARIHSTDPSQELTKMAEAGAYSIHNRSGSLLESFALRLLTKKARKFGFESSKTPDGQHVLTSDNVRKNHDVTFAAHNLADDPVLPFEADLITCHNVLPHVVCQDPDEAVGILAGMVMNLRLGGVLSIATHDHMFDEPFGTYPQWHTLATSFLLEKAGLTTFADVRVRDHYVMFQKL